METYLWITSIWGVYLALAVFIGGMAWRIYQWSTTPKSPVRLGMFPKPKTKVGRFGKLMKDTFIAPQSAKIAPVMWGFAFMFHVAALAVAIGHLHIVIEYPFLPELLGEEGMEALATIAGGIAGIMMLVGILFWIARRTFGAYKNLSVPEDYLLLTLLLGVVLMGDHMRFVGNLEADTYRVWFNSILALKPVIPVEMIGSNTGLSLGTHMLFTDLFLIYFPFSKMVHAIGAFSSNLVRSE
ncbi:MAG: respiratory nitrate reductase subunit gamma [Coriobacteriia bacterium]|nr:respiratory nitrate reductase subunit gamma [Coriobacteriia bacterium]